MAKSETKTRATAASVDAFIDAVDDPVRREDARALDTLMQKVTGASPRMWGPTMIGYGDYHYRYASGHEGDAMRIGFSPRKAELVLYILSGGDTSDEDEEALLAKLGKHRRGKGCLYVKRLDGIDTDVLEELATLRWQRMAARYPA